MSLQPTYSHEDLQHQLVAPIPQGAQECWAQTSFQGEVIYNPPSHCQPEGMFEGGELDVSSPWAASIVYAPPHGSVCVCVCVTHHLCPKCRH